MCCVLSVLDTLFLYRNPMPKIPGLLELYCFIVHPEPSLSVYPFGFLCFNSISFGGKGPIPDSAAPVHTLHVDRSCRSCMAFCRVQGIPNRSSLLAYDRACPSRILGQYLRKGDVVSSGLLHPAVNLQFVLTKLSPQLPHCRSESRYHGQLQPFCLLPFSLTFLCLLSSGVYGVIRDIRDSYSTLYIKSPLISTIQNYRIEKNK